MTTAPIPAPGPALPTAAAFAAVRAALIDAALAIARGSYDPTYEALDNLRLAADAYDAAVRAACGEALS